MQANFGGATPFLVTRLVLSRICSLSATGMFTANGNGFGTVKISWHSSLSKNKQEHFDED